MIVIVVGCTPPLNENPHFSEALIKQHLVTTKRNQINTTRGTIFHEMLNLPLRSHSCDLLLAIKTSKYEQYVVVIEIDCLQCLRGRNAALLSFTKYHLKH